MTYTATLWACPGTREGGGVSCQGHVYLEPDAPPPRCQAVTLRGVRENTWEAVCGRIMYRVGDYELVAA